MIRVRAAQKTDCPVERSEAAQRFARVPSLRSGNYGFYGANPCQLLVDGRRLCFVDIHAEEAVFNLLLALLHKRYQVGGELALGIVEGG